MKFMAGAKNQCAAFCKQASFKLIQLEGIFSPVSTGSANLPIPTIFFWAGCRRAVSRSASAISNLQSEARRPTPAYTPLQFN
jgi:hypothetical protein